MERLPLPVRPSFGTLLRQWRLSRRLSQLDLAGLCETTTRHLSFLETGRASPSRSMVLRLARVLRLPHRETNLLLKAAGFADLYRETPLEAAVLTPHSHIIDLILQRHEPYPAFVIDRRWNVLRANGGTQRLLDSLLPSEMIEELGQPLNVLKIMFHARGLRCHIANWPECGEHLIQRVHREAIDDAEAGELLSLILDLGETPEYWRRLDIEAAAEPVLPIRLRLGDEGLSFVSVITTFGAPQDITLQELRIEAIYPVDTATGRRFETLFA